MRNNTLLLSVLFTTCLISYGSAFALSQHARPKAVLSRQSFAPIPELVENDVNPRVGPIANLIATMAFIIPSTVSAADDYEIAELPPVYVPILFAIGILGGVGVLTASLGDVMDEGM